MTKQTPLLLTANDNGEIIGVIDATPANVQKAIKDALQDHYGYSKCTLGFNTPLESFLEFPHKPFEFLAEVNDGPEVEGIHEHFTLTLTTIYS